MYVCVYRACLLWASSRLSFRCRKNNKRKQTMPSSRHLRLSAQQAGRGGRLESE